MKKILIVDDFEGNRELLEDIVSECYEVDTAKDGQEAIEQIEQGKDYNLILLDLMMPRVDGFGVLEYMKKHDLLDDCPVIIISGDSHVETESRCFDYGVSDFIAKPFKEKIILKRVDNILSLKEAIKSAEAANRSKTSFLFSLSHDIRTPMNAIMGYSDLLEKKSAIDENGKNYLDKIKTSSGFLLSLINSVLELSRIESGNVVIEDELVETESIVSSLCDVFDERMKQKHIRYTCQTDITSKWVYLDKVKVNEVFLNLLSNAYKYTEEGGSVSFSVEELPCETDGYTKIKTTVADTGIGMSEEYLPTLFDEFSREGSAIVNKIEGTGLGMPIVKKLVDLMGGTIEVESKLGEGTTFVVTLQHRIGEEADVHGDTEASLDLSVSAGKRILLAEDNEINAELATIILEDYGFIVDHAENGEVCVEKLMNSEGHYYDLILMDIQMPMMNGYEAARRIRQLEEPYHRSIPIIAMTADAFAENIRECRAVGMNGHVSKPIDVQNLLNTMMSVWVNTDK